MYDAGEVRIYRESPRQSWIEQRRPVTLADGFSEQDVALGLCGITIKPTGPWPEAQARPDKYDVKCGAYFPDLGRSPASEIIGLSDEASDWQADIGLCSSGSL